MTTKKPIAKRAYCDLRTEMYITSIVLPFVRVTEKTGGWVDLQENSVIISEWPENPYQPEHSQY